MSDVQCSSCPAGGEVALKPKQTKWITNMQPIRTLRGVCVFHFLFVSKPYVFLFI